MKKLIVLVFVALLSGCSSTPRPMTTDLSNGMSRQEVIQMFGKPVNATMSDGVDYLVYQIHDHAYGRDKNYYSMGFRDGRLISVNVLPDDEQDLGPVDRILRRKRH